MNENTKVNLVKKLEVTDLSGEKVMIDFSTGKYFLLKGSANEIWDILINNSSDSISVNDIRNELMKIYDVDSNTCLTSIISFLTQIEKNDFIKCYN